MGGGGGGLITQLIGNYQRTKLVEQKNKMDQIGREIQVNRYVLMDPNASPADKQAATQNIDQLVDQYGGPQGKAHRPVLGQILRGLAGGVLGGLGVVRNQQVPQTPAGQQGLVQRGPAQAAEGVPGAGAVPGASPPPQIGGVPPNAFWMPQQQPQQQPQPAPVAGRPVTPAMLAGQPQLAPAAGLPAAPLSTLAGQRQRSLQAVSPEELRWARLNTFAGGQGAAALEQERQLLADAVRRKEITPEDAQERLRRDIAEPAAVARTAAAETLRNTTVELNDGTVVPALETRAGTFETLNHKPIDPTTIKGVGVKTPAAAKTASIPQQVLDHELQAKALEVGTTVDKLTPAQWLDAYNKSKAKAQAAVTADEGPPYDPTKPQPTLKPGERNEEALRGLPEGTVRIVKALVDYSYPIPTGGFALSRKDSPWIKYLDLAKQYDPTFNVALYSTRQAAIKDVTSGKTSQNIRSFNTLVRHLNSLNNSAAALNNYHSGDWSAGIRNWFNLGARTATQDPRLTRFSTDLSAVEDEMATAFKGTPGTDAQIKAWGSKVSAASSPEQLRAFISEAVDLVGGRINAVKEQFTATTGLPFKAQFLTPENEQILSRLGGGEGGGGGAAGGGAAGDGGGAALPKPARQGQLISTEDADKYLERYGDNMDEAMKAAQRDGWRVK